MHPCTHVRMHARTHAHMHTQMHWCTHMVYGITKQNSVVKISWTWLPWTNALWTSWTNSFNKTPIVKPHWQKIHFRHWKNPLPWPKQERKHKTKPDLITVFGQWIKLPATKPPWTKCQYGMMYGSICRAQILTHLLALHTWMKSHLMSWNHISVRLNLA